MSTGPIIESRVCFSSSVNVVFRPAAVKLRSVRERPGPRYAVANGEEGEPLSVKDRWLLRVRPHLVLDGLVQVAPAYVAGEETAVVRAINGGPALPTDKPPRPFESGVAKAPTLVSDVETLANLPGIEATGPSTFLLTLSGPGRAPALHEARLGERLGYLLPGGPPPRGALMGGFSAGLVGPRILRLPLSHRELRAEGTGLGCGAIRLLGEAECAVRVAADVMAYLERDNARQCGPCLKGTAALSEVLGRLAAGSATETDTARIATWSTSLRGRGTCAYLDGATNVAATLLGEFREDVELHLSGDCPRSRPHPPNSSASTSTSTHRQPHPVTTAVPAVPGNRTDPGNVGICVRRGAFHLVPDHRVRR